MIFRTSDYSIGLKEEFPFAEVLNTKEIVYGIKKTDHGIIVTKKDKIEFLKNGKTETKKIGKFVSPVTSLEANNNIIVGGDQRGTIKVLDYSKNIICQFEEHTDQINEIKIIGKNKVLSCSNDMKVKVFDFTNIDKTFLSHNFHKDYITGIDYNKFENTIYSCGMDKKMIIYDLKSNKMSQSFEMNYAIEKLRCLNDHEIILASKYQLFKYDCRNMKVVNSAYIHTKEVSDISIYENKIYTASRDGILKSFNNELKMISQVKFDGSISAMDIYKNEIIIGLEDGNVFSSLKNNIDKTKDEKKIKNEKPKSRYYEDEPGAIIKKIKYCEEKKSEIELHINNNQHFLAVTSVINSLNQANIAFAVFNFIYQQKGLKIVLGDRKKDEILLLLNFLIENLHIIEFRVVNLEMITIILGVYERFFMIENEYKEKLDYIFEMFSDELHFQKAGIKFLGFCETYLLDRKPN